MTDRLLEYVQRRANPGGLVMASEKQLIEKLDTSQEHLARAVAYLESEGKIEVLAPLPFLVLKLRSWSDSSARRARERQQISSHPASMHIDVPVSSSAAAATQPEDGGPGEGEALLDDVVAALGPEADREEFRQILAGYHPAFIRRCLHRVMATKAIRVSRAALFRSLLEKLSK